MRGGEIETEAQNVHDALAAVVAGPTTMGVSSIGNYQVAATALADLQANIDALSLVEGGLRVKRGMISAAGKQVAALVAELQR